MLKRKLEIIIFKSYSQYLEDTFFIFFTFGNVIVLTIWYPLQTVKRYKYLPQCFKKVVMKLQEWMEYWLQPRSDPNITTLRSQWLAKAS